MLEDEGLQEEVGVTLGVNLTIGGASFERKPAVDAVRRAYADPQSLHALEDVAKQAWELRIDPEDGTSLLFRHEKTGYRTRGMLGQEPTAERRLDRLDRILGERGIGREALGDWRERMAGGQLKLTEIDALEKAIAAFPPSAARAVADSLDEGGVRPSQLVPRDPAYYERLVGQSGAATLSEFAKDPARAAIDWAHGTTTERARWLLLRAGRPRLLDGSELDRLGAGELRELGTWVTEDGDLLSKTAFVELALARPKVDPKLEGPILAIAKEIEALDPEDKSSPLYLLSALAIFVEGELSLQATLAGWPPFRRRQASLAQAALISQSLLGEIETGRFADYCIAERGWRFVLQNLMDLRKEPRWRPDFMAPGQLRNEFLGRIASAASPLKDEQLAPALRDYFRGEDGGLAGRLALPMAFWPGPLEGGSDNILQDASPELQAAIEEGLAQEPLTASDLNALVNSHMIVRFPRALGERAVVAINEAGPKLLAALAPQHADAYLLAIAALAATQRLPELADTVQILARYHRNRQKVPLEQELHLMLVACASREDEGAWRDRIGEWCLELASRIEDPEEARSMRAWLDAMAEVDPVLKTRTGRARATLNLVLGE
jgi:hypothetical protein